MTRRESAAGNDECRVTRRQREAHAGSDHCTVAGTQNHGVRCDEISSRVVRMRIRGRLWGDNGDVHRFDHPTRLMQNAGAYAARPAAYRERLAPSLWLMAAAAVSAPMVALALAPLHSTIALAGGALVAAALVALMIVSAPVVAVEDGCLRAGRAHIDATLLGEPVVLTGAPARHARGPGLSADSWHLVRGGIDGLVVVPVRDPDDPVRAWVLSSRTPDRLAGAIRRARVRPSTPHR